MTWLAQRSIFRDGTDLVYVRKIGDEIDVAQPVNFEFKRLKQYEAIAEPTLVIHGNGGQELMQALWDAGLRPNNGAGSGAEAVALRKHIDFAESMANGLLARFVPQTTGHVGDEHGE